MNFKQRVGWAFHRSRVAQGAQQAAHEGGFASAQIAMQPNRQAFSQAGGLREACA
ncbi:MAG: hypothetical protein RugAbin2_01240 [Rugosibacter sp.]|nr:hypothetical protein [Rugosibacter sp.]